MDTSKTPASGGRPRRRPRFLSCKCAAICLSLTTFVALLTLTCFVFIPATVSMQHEAEYFEKLERDRRHERRRKWLPTALETPSTMNPHESPAVPLIKDIPQLSTHEWQRQMDMNADWTAQSFASEIWIYVGGTAEVAGEDEEKKKAKESVKTAGDINGDQRSHIHRQSSSQLPDYDGFNMGVRSWQERYLHELTSFVLGSPRLKRALSVVVPLPGPTCIDPPDTCDAFNQGFDRLIEFYHTHRKYQSANTALTFVDCDISPVLCSEWGLDPVMLAHVQTSLPCEMKWLQGGDDRCSVQWRFVGLPLKKMPFTRNVRLSSLLASSGVPSPAPSTQQSPADLASDPLVPVFPSVFEQIHALVSHSGSVDALDFEEWEMWDIVAVEETKIT